MSTRRPPRDPAAPKRNMSAYLLYQNAMRDTFKQQVSFSLNFSSRQSLLFEILSVHSLCFNWLTEIFVILI